MKRVLVLLSLLAVTLVPALAQDATTRVRGTIVSFEGNVLTVATATENRRITLTEGFRVLSVVKAELAKIVPGAYVGSAATTQPDGTLRAQRSTSSPRRCAVPARDTARTISDRRAR